MLIGQHAALLFAGKWPGDLFLDRLTGLSDKSAALDVAKAVASAIQAEREDQISREITQKLPEHVSA